MFSGYCVSGTRSSKHSASGMSKWPASRGASPTHRPRQAARSIPQEAAWQDGVCGVRQEDGTHRIIVVSAGERAAEHHFDPAARTDEEAEGGAGQRVSRLTGIRSFCSSAFPMSFLQHLFGNATEVDA